MTNEKASETKTVRKEVRIKAPASAVWKMLTEADGLIKWFPTGARVNPGVGGGIWLSWGPGMEGGEGKIQIWEPERHLRKDSKSMNGKPLTVDFYIETEGGETVLRLVHSGFGTGPGWDDDEYDSIDSGWGLYMKNLRHYLERHAGERCLHKWTPFKMTVSLDDGWKRLVGAEGLVAKGSLPLEKGARFSFETADGTKLEGLVEVAQRPRVLALTVTNLNDALFRFTMDKMGVCFAGFDFFAYGPSEAKAVAVHDALVALCKKVFAPGA